MKTSELSGAALDWAVANCEGLVSIDTKNLFEPWYLLRDYIPSTNWAQGGPIIERDGVSLIYENGDWCATLQGKPTTYFSYNPLVSAMRCYVANKLGDEIELPEELLQGE